MFARAVKMKKNKHVFSKATKVSFFIFMFFLPWKAIFHLNVISKSNLNRLLSVYLAEHPHTTITASLVQIFPRFCEAIKAFASM